jgi:hypothetical protein
LPHGIGGPRSWVQATVSANYDVLSFGVDEALAVERHAIHQRLAAPPWHAPTATKQFLRSPAWQRPPDGTDSRLSQKPERPPLHGFKAGASCADSHTMADEDRSVGAFLRAIRTFPGFGARVGAALCYAAVLVREGGLDTGLLLLSATFGLSFAVGYPIWRRTGTRQTRIR